MHEEVDAINIKK